MRVLDMIGEGMEIDGVGKRKEGGKEGVYELVESVGLKKEDGKR